MEVSTDSVEQEELRMSSDDRELLDRHWEANLSRHEKAPTWAEKAEAAQSLRSLELEYKKRGLEPPDSGSTASGSPGGGVTNDPAVKIEKQRSKLEKDAEVFTRMTGEEHRKLFREDPDRYNQLAEAANEVSMRKLLGLTS